MKKTSAIIMAACLCIGSLTGCEKTPEEVIVKQKGASNIKEYEGEEKGKGSLAKKLKVPEHYTNKVSYEDGKLVIDTDAEVILPEADSMDTISVSAREVNQEMIDTVTKAFFEGDKIYNSESYQVFTKDMIQKSITEWKMAKAEGRNPEELNLPTDQEGNQLSIDEVIENLESDYQTAPETVTREEITPQFGLEYGKGTANSEVYDDWFIGTVETKDGVYDYEINYTLAPDSLFRIEKGREAGTRYQGFVDFIKGENVLDIGDENQMTEEEIKQYEDISYEEALKGVQEKVEKLDWGLELCDWDYVLFYEGEKGFDKNLIVDGGYVFHFARKINGAFITYTDNQGGQSEEGSTVAPWGYERCEIVVGDDGIIHQVELKSPYKVGEVRTENVKLMDFDSIINIYEQMMEVSNADITEVFDQRTYHVKRIELGYARIYDPATDNGTGLLVPVWDFFGGFDCVGDDGYASYNSGEHSTQSFLTINAIDGTIIDRGTGY